MGAVRVERTAAGGLELFGREIVQLKATRKDWNVYYFPFNPSDYAMEQRRYITVYVISFEESTEPEYTNLSWVETGVFCMPISNLLENGAGTITMDGYGVRTKVGSMAYNVDSTPSTKEMALTYMTATRELRASVDLGASVTRWPEAFLVL